MLICAKSETNIPNKHSVLKFQLAGGRPVSYSHSAAEGLNSGRPRTNPVSSREEREEDSNPRPAHYSASPAPKPLGHAAS